MAAINANTDAAADSGVSGHLESRASVLLEEKPCIDAAVRNFLAILLAPHSRSKLPDENGERIEQLDKLDIQRVCGSILRNINAVELLSPPQWCLKVPQKEEQTGLNRMEQIGDYKVLYAACSALSKSSSKITKNLGVSMLRLIWHDVRDKVIAECKTKKIGTEEQIVELLSLYESSFLEDEEKLSSFQEASTDNEPTTKVKDKEMEELVWAVDFKAVLNSRQQKRKVEAKKRMDDIDNEIRETVTNTLTDNGVTSTVTIEELGDGDDPEPESDLPP
uniref:Uncharacterized protein n=2 Tax=Aplanochytrium stocchinoi TaxID=215587 RepID=A0A7S3PIT5_9STRA|mmetsp:Transcript_6007/g.6889  ORF Transcript_6007/g.6889 Transcript_6007/m.6889 type:complete len:277 (+) Transcript_6007:424-1254(+)|eukprot:CAMPEP_0204850696 /NCGR_PEP_ID=MMETSP1347-20130617/8652_1 /ASSEMBLY_ACC=CAM_ASM_000690 /TAXON_ID=215587 /ORGANISM="Aplanochytrium stocchinoi, Strain GSBS06" /LENGTH=276 /DNA_ID=CAMNT_0051993847 /DNA_START=313 /DNA_END=1143 /DNA_ORIENTATION=-